MSTHRALRRIMAANRGEIAIRIFRACTELQRETVAIYGEEDSLSLHRYKADEAYLVGAGLGPVEAYLDIDGILALAREKRVDAIHPGYGFLAENAAFARRCREAGIVFIGPDPEHLELFGDKVRARALAHAAGLPVVPGTPEPVSELAAAASFARDTGFPVLVKAVAGGGGRGMRIARNAQELAQALETARREAAAAFGEGAVYLEKWIRRPRHVEVQVLGDRQGRLVHLWERDCSVQRRHQKVVEVAPAAGLDPGLRREICAAAAALMRRAGYVGAGTVEFLVDGEGRYYFIEVNPRIQVEHTVTELVLGIDIVQAQIRIAEGRSLAEAGVPDPVPEPQGHAIQCRVTTEDPENDFLPDTGRLIAYRSPGGFGVRLDGGNAYAGARISPHYDSLLVKVCTHAATFTDAARKMHRALREFRVRGVKTNIPFLENVVTHPTFLAGQCDTGFIDSHPELFQFPPRRDRGTRLLRYIADVVVNGQEGVPKGATQPVLRTVPVPPPEPVDGSPGPVRNAKAVLDQQGPDALAAWLLRQQPLLLTDTTCRDAHQSLLATRMRTHDLLRIARATGRLLPQLFSLEVWGGATFDTAYRFLKEDPWERLALLRERIPHILLQMLLRGQSLLGYSAYPDNAVRAFVREAAATGIDVFRIFDSLNDLRNMQVAIAAVREAGKVAEVAICYTGDILDRRRRQYNLRYYVDLARSVQAAGAHILAIKDMAGLLKPEAAYRLVKALKAEVGLPVHLHTHDSAGVGVATAARAAAAGVDVVDGCIDALAGGTSQPSLRAIAAALQGTRRDPGLDLAGLQPLHDYWAAVRTHYRFLETSATAPDAGVFRHQMPGGQFTNLRQQAEAVGLGSRWPQVVEAYFQADALLGELIKVTPSSKAVGDLALFMVQNDLTPGTLQERAAELNFPDSVIGLFRGLLGRPPYGFPPDLQAAVLKGQEPLADRPGAYLPPSDFARLRAEVEELTGGPVTERDVLGYLLFPDVFRAFAAHRDEYGDTSVLDTPTFFFGLRPAERTVAEIEPGKTLLIRLLGVGEQRADGQRDVTFELNGQAREVRVRDRGVTAARAARPKAARGDWRQVAASMPGKVLRVLVAPGDIVQKGQALVLTEAMKLETAIGAPRDAVVAAVLVQPGDPVAGGDLLLRLEPVTDAVEP